MTKKEIKYSFDYILMYALGNWIKSHSQFKKRKVNRLAQEKNFKKIENMFKIKLKISGDVTYDSDIASPLVIHCKTQCVNGVLKFLFYPHTDCKKFCKGVYYYKKLNLMGWVEVDKKFKTYDGFLYKEFYSYPEMRKYAEKKRCSLKKLMRKDVVSAYEEYKEECDDLLERGNINMFHHAFNIKTAMMNMFYYHNRSFMMGKMPYWEKCLIFDTTRSGLKYMRQSCVDVEQEYESYHINSFYPYIMCLKKCLVLPYTEPNCQKLTSLPTILPYGLYNVFISGFTDDTRFIMPNKNNLYTHFDLKTARELGLNIELNEDCKFNAYIYPKRVLPYRIFKNYVDALYPLKQKDVKLAGVLLTGLLESLCKIKRKIININSHNITRKMLGHSYMLENTDGTTSLNMSVPDTKDLFKYDYARIYPFVIAYGRRKLFQTIKPFLDSVVRINTDSIFVLKGTEVSLKLSDKLGDWKKEFDGVWSFKNLYSLPRITHDVYLVQFYNEESRVYDISLNGNSYALMNEDELKEFEKTHNCRRV